VVRSGVEVCKGEGAFRRDPERRWLGRKERRVANLLVANTGFTGREGDGEDRAAEEKFWYKGFQ